MYFDEALQYLLSLGHETLTIKLGLQNTVRLLDALGNPHHRFPAVQIAGTNGKGSTAVMLASICRAAEIRAGVFTSPHLISITERIRVNGEQISETEFAKLTGEVRTAAEQLVAGGRLETLPTFFEHVTAIALLAFRDARVELAILETGLGGRLDSTTATSANLVAITQIAMDHEEYLGHSLAEIAAEKAAILRPGVTATIAPQAEEAREVIRRQCERVGIEPILIEEAVQVSVSPKGNREDGRLCVTFGTSCDRYENVCLGLRGRHQIENGATAIALAEALRERGFAISREAIVKGLESATHPGRLELWDGKPPILFDGAHNPAAARALRDYLDEFVPAPITMIFGAMQDKALAEMASVLFPAADALILTEIENPRAASLDLLQSVVPNDFDWARIRFAATPAEALRLARAPHASTNVVCVTGSLYLVGAIQAMLRDPAGDVASQSG